MSSIENFEKAYLAAEKAERDLRNEMETAISAARAKVRQDFRAREIAAQSLRGEAKRKWDEAKIAAASSSNLIGLKVVRMRHQRVDTWSREIVEVATYGIIDLMKPDTVVSSTAIYNLPRIGDLFVRLLKKDGSPGLKFERYGAEWKPVESEDK